MEAVAHNPPALKQQRDRARKAFSLIEAAIVLGVVGLVIGGIWYSAAAVYENYKVNKTVEGVIIGGENLRNLIPMASVTSNNWITITDLCRLANVFPLFETRDGIGYLISPLGGVGCATHSGAIVIYFGVTTTGICQKVAAGITARYKDNTELESLRIYGADNAAKVITNYPVSPSGTDCMDRVEPPQIRLYFTFKLRN